VVDNGSNDGSAALLVELDRAGVCNLLGNPENVHHGPALNQGLSWLASRPKPPTWVWVLDSDVVVVRHDALGEAVSVAERTGAALIGEPQWDPWHHVDRLAFYSLLLDPGRVWRAGVCPFGAGGDPSFGLLGRAAAKGLPTAPFGFTADGYVIHRGRGSLASVVAAGDTAHPLFAWAIDHHEPHFGGVPGASEHYDDIVEQFRDEVGLLTADSVAGACRPPDGGPA